VRLVRLPVIYVHGHSDKRVHDDVVYAALQMKLEVFPFITEKLARLIYYDPDLFWEPTRG